MRLILFALTILACLIPLAAVAGQGGDASVNEGPRLFIEWPGMDWDYVRREIAFVNYVRERDAAEIVLLVTTQTAGNGATSFTLAWTGRGQFAGLDETQVWAGRPGDAAETVRRDLVAVMKIAIVRYLARTPLAARVRITLDKPRDGDGAAATNRRHDPWNAWLFKLSGSAYLYGVKAEFYESYYAGYSASRVTADWKLHLAASMNMVRDTFYYDTYQTVSETRTRSSSLLSVWSLDRHWSAGFNLTASSSTYQNLDLACGGALAVEYNIFPYAEAARRQWRFLYYLGLKYYDYHEPSMYDKLVERLPYQSLAASLVVKEPWGSAVFTLSGSNYLTEIRKHRFGAYLELSLKLGHGLALDVSGSYTRIADQVYLAASSYTQEDLLLRRYELATSYSCWVSVGVSWTFGSVYNNVVNPRFGG